MIVVDIQYVAPHTVELAVLRKSLANSDGNFTVVDVNGNLMFKIKETRFSFHYRHILYDATDKPILTFKRKLRSIHGRWQAFKGESTTRKDMLFSAKKSSTTEYDTELKVFLAENKEETVCDYKVVGDWETKSCAIYARDESTTLAEMQDKQNVASVVLGKDTFGITVYADVDYVFIIALVVILDQINGGDDGSGKKKKKKMLGKKNSRIEGSSKKHKEKKDEEKEEKDEEKEEKEENEGKEEDSDDEEKEDQEADYDDDDDDFDDDDDDYLEEPEYDQYDDDDDESSTSSSEDETPKKK